MKRLPLIILLIFALLIPDSRDTLGDVNNDGVINVFDIVRIVNIILENNPLPTDYELWASDVNIDDTTDVADIILIVQVILGEDDCPDLYSPCSNNLSQCCMDTTSHNFVWDIQIFGAPAGNINSLYDAHIISDDDIWVVGEIREFYGDTLHNYLHWDGEVWTLGIMCPINTQNYWPYYLRSVYGFSDNDVWVAITVPSHFDGNEWHEFNLDEEGFPHDLGASTHIWGTNSENMYFGEHSGDIVHWDGSEFTIMETTTGSGSQYNSPFPIHDLFGLDENHIWTIAGHTGLLNEDHPLKLSYYNGEEWADIYEINSAIQGDDALGGRLYRVWSYGDTLYVSAAFNGVWRESITTGEGSYFPLDSLEYINAGWSRGKGLDGNNHSDIFTVSQIAKYAHYNGAGWYFGNEVYDYFESTGQYQLCDGIAVNGNTVILFGNLNLGQQVWVARGVRQD